MIIVKLIGGLGNQMFQYAAARSLSLRHGTELKLDLFFLEGEQVGNTPRKFELDNFCITAEKASRWEVSSMSGRGSSRLATTCARLFQRAAGYTDYREKFFHFDPRVSTLPDNVYLEGYWQSERYFADIGDIIRKEFMVTPPLTGRNLELACEIQSVNSVSLHVRRGDYVTEEKTHGVCDIEYYRKAEERVAQELGNPEFFVFSDDPEWVASNLKLRHPARYIRNNGGMPHEDLRLMSLCRHNIIANSSFSWWGAWLNDNPGKSVFAPREWFRDKRYNTADILPESWIKL
ncbi:MAG TPA: alpha-1,2-fucosyltransferase [Dongiaceae bacterium]|nr:alpha-1,2-fucosyltransferase [Dongiaceae bacterium]